MSDDRSGWHTFDVECFEVLVGRSARANDELTFRVARPRDVWMHAAGYAGSHVVVRVGDEFADVPGNVIERAAALAAWHSKARHARGKIDVHVCRVAPGRFNRPGAKSPK
jgi:predicted ribosome quality control (RQC) complex YloA/Tae2 family protein